MPIDAKIALVDEVSSGTRFEAGSSVFSLRQLMLDGPDSSIDTECNRLESLPSEDTGRSKYTLYMYMYFVKLTRDDVNLSSRPSSRASEARPSGGIHFQQPTCTCPHLIDDGHLFNTYSQTRTHITANTVTKPYWLSKIRQRLSLLLGLPTRISVFIKRNS